MFTIPHFDGYSAVLVQLKTRDQEDPPRGDRRRLAGLRAAATRRRVPGHRTAHGGLIRAFVNLYLTMPPRQDSVDAWIFRPSPASPLSLEDLIGAVVREAADDAPLTRLRTAASMTQVVNDVTDAGLGYFVDQARRAGHSWSEIGEALGVSKQAAQQRQRHRTVTLTMPLTFERFTERARNVLTSSKSIAQELGHDYVGTEHLLLAQYSEPEGLGAQILSRVRIAGPCRSQGGTRGRGQRLRRTRWSIGVHSDSD